MCWPSVQRLVIVSSVVHYHVEGELYAYGPYAREIDIWADLFQEVVIAAPLHRGPPSGDSIPFARKNISIAPQLETGGVTFSAKAVQVLLLPFHLWRLGKAMAQADAIHVRCPANLGLLGCLLAPCFRKPRVAKYANSWPDYPGEPLTYRWQKSLLRSRWWNAPVLVYGSWPDQPVHIVPFFTSIMDEAQVAHARRTPPRDWAARPLELLYVGRLSSDKNVDVTLRALALLGRESKDFRLTVVGDGPARQHLEGLSNSMGLINSVRFLGALGHGEVLKLYEKGHILVLVSRSEGWPKAISEAMAFGLLCIGSNRGLVPQMLDGRGLVVEPGSPEALAERFLDILKDSSKLTSLCHAAAAWSQQFTLQELRKRLAESLPRWWKLETQTLSGCAGLSRSSTP